MKGLGILQRRNTEAYRPYFFPPIISNSFPGPSGDHNILFPRLRGRGDGTWVPNLGAGKHSGTSPHASASTQAFAVYEIIVRGTTLILHPRRIKFFQNFDNWWKPPATTKPRITFFDHFYEIPGNWQLTQTHWNVTAVNYFSVRRILKASRSKEGGGIA